MRDLMEAELTRKDNDDDDDDQNVAETLSKVSLDDDDQKEDMACALKDPQKIPNTKQEEVGNEAARQQIPKAEANLLTFHRQKLALMQCEYNTKCCTWCKIPGAGKSLKSCAKCKTAKYCSKECQSQDWKEKHKVQCQEMRRLQATIERYESNAERSFTRVKAIADGKPWSLDRGMEYYKLCIRDDKFFVMGVHTGKFSNVSFLTKKVKINEGFPTCLSLYTLVGLFTPSESVVEAKRIKGKTTNTKGNFHSLFCFYSVNEP